MLRGMIKVLFGPFRKINDSKKDLSMIESHYVFQGKMYGLVMILLSTYCVPGASQVAQW